MIFEHFKSGINLGGWLSQYDCVPPSAVPTTRETMEHHLSTFITEEDIARIASWGLDHIRLPIDYRVLEETRESLTDRETALDYIDKCVGWCRKHGLGIMLDLHHAEGNVYGAMGEPMPLLTDETLKHRFVAIWEGFAEHFKGVSEPMIIFELLNEVSDGSGYLWNALAGRTVEAIRAIDPTRGILIGCNEQNSVFRLKELDLLEDEHVYYNFHFYEPLPFTHQRAHFSEDMLLYNKQISYPGEIPGFTEFLLEHREYVPKCSHIATENEVSKESMCRLLKDAFDFVKYSGRELYCGEMGVINSAEQSDIAGWLCDLIAVLDEHRIGHAIWNYKELDFGFVDIEGNLVSEEKVKRVFGV